MLRTLNFRLQFLLVLVALPGLVAVILQTLAERDMAIEAYRKESHLVAEDLAATQREIIQSTRQFLEELAQADPVQDPSDPACGAFVAELLPFEIAYVNLGVPRADGALLCNALPMTHSVNVADRAYFRRAVDGRMFSVGTFQTDRAAGVTSVNFAYPVEPRGASGPVAGAVVAVVSLGWWGQRLGAQDLPEGAIALILDREGTIVAQHPPSLGALGQSLASLDVLGTRAEAAKGEPVRGRDGVRRVVSRSVLFEDGAGHAVRVVIGIPVEEALRRADANALLRFLLLGGALVLVWSMAMGLLTRDVLRPLAALTGAVRELEAGQSGEGEARMTARVQEFRHLSSRFETMAGARRAAEESEAQRARELEALLDAVPDLYFRMDADTRILDYRASNGSDLLLLPETFMGRRMEEMLPGRALELFTENMARHAETREIVSWEYPLEIDGRPLEFEARACPVKGADETILVVRNITGRRRAEEGLRLAAMVFENSSEGMIVVDPDGRITSVNPAVSEQTGHRADKLVGMRFSKLVPREHRDRLARRLAGLTRAPGDREAGGWSGELAFRHAEGGQFPVWLSINLVEADSFAPRRFVILSRDMTDLYEANETIWHQAHFDSLTELPNRVSLAEGLGRAIAEAQDQGEEVALLYLDLDRLKQVNDRMGHTGGDLVLAELAARLRDTVEPEDLVARQGGDEFIVVLTGPDVGLRADRMAEALVAAVSAPYPMGGQEAHMSCSLGIALFPQDAGDGEALLQAADLAMYSAKLAGGNRSRRYSAKIGEVAQDRLHLMEDLNGALARDEFELHFQPIVELGSGAMVKVEALIRWNHPRLGLIGPDRFIPLAEEARLVGAIGDWVLARSCAALPRLRQRFGDGLKLCLNVSPVQLTEPQDSMAGWADCLAEAGLEPGAIVAEITESTLLGTNPKVAERLGQMRQMGMQLALDDFGTGYATLQHCLSYEFDVLKIDRAFVKDLPDKPAARILCETILDLARRLDAQVIAEGIETPAQRRFLSAHPGLCGQGFLFAVPLTLEECLTLPRRFPIV
ncbi:bifunctional diguanylate cyclase/phosphodiesterase [Aliiroseovarius sp.]|uniref:bifunctional diguanylate cyclase/phosphodiesterase n=1 Tax=Aliiroseovarius sp. TaxID=1872442 RepID=UPI003BABF00F